MPHPRGMYEHIILHFPALGRYSVFYKEGGAQNFDMSEGELPDTLRKYIEECRREKRVWECDTNLRTLLGIKELPANANPEHLHLVLYSLSCY